MDRVGRRALFSPRMRVEGNVRGNTRERVASGVEINLEEPSFPFERLLLFRLLFDTQEHRHTKEA